MARLREPNPGAYEAALEVVRDLVARVEREAGGRGTVGVGAPGSVSPRTGVVRNANSTWLNGRPFREDLERALERPVRLANDANCLALSEASDGAAAGRASRFAVILGTGCGGGVVVDGRADRGRQRHRRRVGARLPALARGGGGSRAGVLVRPARLPGDLALRDRPGAGLRGGHRPPLTGESSRARGPGDAEASAALDRYVDRLGRALAMVCNLLDPEVFVLGGGLSNVRRSTSGFRRWWAATCSPTRGRRGWFRRMGRLLGRPRRGATLGAAAVDLRRRVGLASAIGEERSWGSPLLCW